MIDRIATGLQGLTMRQTGERSPVGGEGSGSAPATALSGTLPGAVGYVRALPLADPGDAPVDAPRIAAIRSAIAEGRYPVDPALIAERMIAFERGAADERS